MYKGKKNKALVAIARDEWKLTAASKKAFSKGLWIRHVKGHSNHEWNNVADKLAGDANFKRRTRIVQPVPSSAFTSNLPELNRRVASLLRRAGSAHKRVRKAAIQAARISKQLHESCFRA